MQIVNELKSKLQSHIDSVTALAKQAAQSTEYNVNVVEIGSTEKQHAELNAYLNSLKNKQGLDDIVQDIMQEYEIDDGHALYETLNDLCHNYQSILDENIEVYLVAKMSEIERIGIAMFGKSWMAQIAANLKNAKGEPLTRQTVQNWHRRGNLPEWAKEQLETLVKKRENEIKAIAPIAQKGRKMKSISFDVLTAISAITTNCEPDKNAIMEIGFNYYHDVPTVKFICKTSLDCSAQVTVYDFGDKLKIEVSLEGNLRSDDQNIFKDIIGQYETENEFLDAYERWQKSSGNSDLDFGQDE